MVRCHCTTWQPVRGYRGKAIGRSDGRTFRKTIKGSKHLLRSPRAIAIDAEAYDHEIALNCQYIEICDTESRTLYQSTVVDFDRYKGELNRGHGRQYYLRLSRWQITNLSSHTPRQLPLDLGVANA